MRRLRKVADPVDEKMNMPEDLQENQPSIEEAQQLVNESYQKIVNLVDSYKSMYESLNLLAKKYPKLYDDIKLVVKFPNEKDAEDIVEMKNNFEDLLEHYQDAEYLKSIIGLPE